MIRIIDHPYMPIVVYHGLKATNQINKGCMVWPFWTVMLVIIFKQWYPSNFSGMLIPNTIVKTSPVVQMLWTPIRLIL